MFCIKNIEEKDQKSEESVINENKLSISSRHQVSFGVLINIIGKRKKIIKENLKVFAVVRFID